MINPEEKKAVVDLFPFMGDSPVVFDCGSNKGDWADIVLEEYKEGKCSLHLFEPNKKLLSFTEIKYEYGQNIFFYNVGLLNENGGKDFYLFENFNNEISSFYDGEDKWEGLPVKKNYVDTRKGDWICEQLKIDNIDYLKIDCEGSDVETLQGFSEMMRQDKIGIIQIEYSEHWQRAKHSYSDLKNIAGKYGYKIYRYIGDNFWEEKSETPEYDNYFLTKYEIHNYCISGSNDNFILNTIDLPKMDVVIEVGCMEGITTKYICENLLNKENPDARVICIDPLFDYYVKDDPRYHPEFKGQYPRFLRNTRGLPVNLIRGKSQEELPKLNALRVDLIYLDGDHYAPQPYWDACWCFALLKINGYLLIDDVNLWMDDTRDSVYKFLDEYRGSLEIVRENYQVLIKKIANQYNEITYPYYK